MSPSLNQGIGMGYVLNTEAFIDNIVYIGVRDKKLSAKIVKPPLSTEQNHILNQLDEIIHDEKFSVSYDLKQYDMTFFNNHRIIHGRTSFEDFDESDKRRLFISN